MLRFVVLGTFAANPWAGLAWMTMQYAVALRRMGHDVWYLESSSNWPYDPVKQEKVAEADYAVAYLERVATWFGFGDRWAFRRSWGDDAWIGPAAGLGDRLLLESDAVLSIHGSTRLEEEGLSAGRLVFVDTDPIWPQVRYAEGDPDIVTLVDEHDDVVTYGENIGRGNGCPLPSLPNTRGWMRQPIVLDFWDAPPPARDAAYTTIANWKQGGRDLVIDGRLHSWSKHIQFLKVLELPQRVRAPIELATNLTVPPVLKEVGEGDPIPAWGAGGISELLSEHGWRLVDSSFTTELLPYRDYIRESRGEFAVARDMHIRSRSGWFSERGACYLAAGRPVVTQDTGFGEVIPTGEGLLTWQTLDEAVAAIEEVESDYERHARAARAIAKEYFDAEKVLAKMLDDLGL